MHENFRSNQGAESSAKQQKTSYHIPGTHTTAGLPKRRNSAEFFKQMTRTADDANASRGVSSAERMPADTGILVAGGGDYTDALRVTKRDYESQGVTRMTYQMNPDNRATLWNMIEKFKGDKEDLKQKQIAQKTANAAQHFRKVNMAQKELDDRMRREAMNREKRSDQIQLANDMVEFEK